MISDWNLYVITDSRICPGRSHIEEAKAAVAAGVKVIQLREKQMIDREIVTVGKTLRSITAKASVDFIVNNRVDMALALDADGVHVGQEDMPVPLVRQLMGPNKIIGASASTVAEAIRAEKDGADYVSASPVFATMTKTDAPPSTGLSGLKEISEAVSIPVVAIGGIDLRNVEEVIAAGADVIAVVSAVVCAQDMRKAAEELLSAIRAAKSRKR
ncbi:thiamine phosphate synthase [Candidatus Bathyarchaeota archaeon]|jgi:thiamine-phosphate pyrophosphorylase|nr:thiamine phosphate synthase [Candidatus Bathyarchaeota archaeon]